MPLHTLLLFCVFSSFPELFFFFKSNILYFKFFYDVVDIFFLSTRKSVVLLTMSMCVSANNLDSDISGGEIPTYFNLEAFQSPEGLLNYY